MISASRLDHDIGNAAVPLAPDETIVENGDEVDIRRVFLYTALQSH